MIYHILGCINDDYTNAGLKNYQFNIEIDKFLKVRALDKIFIVSFILRYTTKLIDVKRRLNTIS